MTQERERAAVMFEMLTILHLDPVTLPGQRGETNPQIEDVLSGLQRMSEEQWFDFLRFAELQRVYLRTVRLLGKLALAGAVVPRFDSLEDLAQAEERRIAVALASLDKVVRALELTG